MRSIDNNILKDTLQKKILRTWINIHVNSFIKYHEMKIEEVTWKVIRNSVFFLFFQDWKLQNVVIMFLFFSKSAYLLPAKITLEVTNSLKLDNSFRDAFRNLSNIKDGVFYKYS